MTEPKRSEIRQPTPKPDAKTAINISPKSSGKATHKKVDPEDILALWRQYKQNPGHGALREKLILSYLHLVRYVVSRLPVTLPISIATEDLISYGTLGLMEAVERFDPERGLKFETYAVTRIRGAIIDQLRFQDWIPRGVRKRSRDLGEAMHRLEEQLGRAPNDDELAQELGVTKTKLQTMLAESNNLMLSLDDTYGSDQSGSKMTLLDTVEDSNSPDPQGEFEANELRNRLATAIASLPEREKLLIALYYHENMTLKEIGEVICVSESRVCQLHAQAILRLRSKLSQ
ncbi:MAG: FliA/WhiG family RNA polymerase sigma factor [Vampirovibrionales bacterium]|nr:FliA/WhiG family RNA polymerase sigma factor [Vampirovibrionales bacterium]